MLNISITKHQSFLNNWVVLSSRVLSEAQAYVNIWAMIQNKDITFPHTKSNQINTKQEQKQ